MCSGEATSIYITGIEDTVVHLSAGSFHSAALTLHGKVILHKNLQAKICKSIFEDIPQFIYLYIYMYLDFSPTL